MLNTMLKTAQLIPTLTNIKKIREVNKFINLYDALIVKEADTFEARMKLIREINRLDVIREGLEKLPIREFNETYVEYHIEIPSKLNKL
jgi:hypothetical protein